MRHQHGEDPILAVDGAGELKVPGRLDAGALWLRKLDTPDVGKVVAVTLRAEKLLGPAAQAAEERIVPDRLFDHGRCPLLPARSAACAEMRRALELVHHLADGMVRRQERREHRAADVGRMRAGDQRLLNGDGSSHRNGRAPSTRRAGIGHQGAPLDDGHMQQLEHPSARRHDGVGLIRRLRVDCLGQWRRLRAGGRHRHLLGKLLLQLRQHVLVRDAGLLEFTSPTQQRAEPTVFRPAGGQQITRLDVHAHGAGKTDRRHPASSSFIPPLTRSFRNVPSIVVSKGPLATRVGPE